MEMQRYLEKIAARFEVQPVAGSVVVGLKADSDAGRARGANLELPLGVGS